MTDHQQKDQFSSTPARRQQRQAHSKIIHEETSNERWALISSLSRIFGLRFWDAPHPDHDFLNEVGLLFRRQVVEAESPLEKHGRAWANVYLVQHGVVRLFRESPSGKIAIHHFFSEGDMIWPVFGRSRTARNTLCLTAVTPCTLWVADFRAFRSVVQSRNEEQWARFALALTEELAETSTMREFQRATMPASERYQILLRDYPELVERVPNSQLAAWMGVVPATFSRLKHSK